MNLTVGNPDSSNRRRRVSPPGIERRHAAWINGGNPPGGCADQNAVMIARSEAAGAHLPA